MNMFETSEKLWIMANGVKNENMQKYDQFTCTEVSTLDAIVQHSKHANLTEMNDFIKLCLEMLYSP